VTRREQPRLPFFGRALWLRALYFVQGIFVGITMVFLSLHFKRQGFDSEQIGLLSSMGPSIGILLTGFFGVLADRTFHRNRLLVGAICCGTGRSSHFW
jgi:hypothetical protein